MLAIISDNKHIQLDQVAGAEEVLIRWFSVRDPRAHYMQGPAGDIGNAWDGWYRRYHTRYQRLALPFLEELKRCCTHFNIPLEVIDKRPAPIYPAPQPDQITNTLIEGITLEDYQVRAMKAACDYEVGLFSAKTGAGKTELMCGLIKMFRCPTLVLTDQIVVLNQIVERLRIRKVVHRDDIGMFCFGKMPDDNLVIVGSIQSVSTPSKPEKEKTRLTGKQILNRCMKWIEAEQERQADGHEPFSDEQRHLLKALPHTVADSLINNPEEVSNLPDEHINQLVDYCNGLEWERRRKWYASRIKKAKAIQEFVRRCDMCLVDEADLATTQQYARLFKHYFNGRRRYGFSGTPFDKQKPVQNLMLKEHLGSIIASADRDEVEQAGRIVPITFFMIAVGLDGNKEDKRAYDIAMKEEIINNEKFHKLVAKLVAQYPDDGTLILVDTSPIEPLGKALEDIIPGAKFIYGKTKNKQRDGMIKKFESRELKCLIGSKILKRGFDLKGGCENLIIIGGGGKWSDFNQKVGRAVRLNKRGKARVFGFFFLNNKYLYTHSRENLKAVVSMGYKAKVLIRKVAIDGEKFITSRFRIPKGV